VTAPRVVPALRPMNEIRWRGQVVDLAQLRGWKVYWTWNSVHSPAGFPDLVLIRPPRLIFAELKTDRRGSKTTAEQDEWLEALTACTRQGVQTFVWRPSNFDEMREVLW